MAQGERKGEVPYSSFPGWMEVLHPSQTVIPARQVPLTLGELRWQCHSQNMGRTRAQHQRAEEHRQAMQEKYDLTSSPESPEPIPKVALPPGFKEVAACLLGDSPSLAPIEDPLEPRQPDTLTGPTVATVYTTQIVQDEATGVTSMATVTASVGKVALRNPHMVANLQGPTVEDITDLP